MAKVVITKSKLDNLATVVSEKAGVATPLTIDQMSAAVQGIEIDGGGTPTLQSKTATPTESQQTITPDIGYDGLSQVIVNPISVSTLSATANGTYTPSAGSYYSSVEVAVGDSDINLQSKTVTPSTIPVSVTPDSNYQGLSSVTVNAIPSQYANINNVTATASDVIQNKIFVDNTGTEKVGNLIVSSYYVGTEVPDSSLGSNGDLYFRI
jgi:hypothetical protein